MTQTNHGLLGVDPADYKPKSKSKSKKGLTRREFIGASAILLLSGKQVYDVLKQIDENKTINTIYHELPEHIYKFNVKSKIRYGEDKHQNHDTQGVGIFYDNKFITTAHIITTGLIPIRTPFGIMNIVGNVEEQEITLEDGSKLECIVNDQKTDVAVLSSDKQYPNFPFKAGEHYLGQDVYIIGNPQLGGSNIRRSRVSNMKFELGCGKAYTDGCFGVENAVIGGDSGSPVVSLDKTLLGLVRANVNGFGYIKDIKHYVDVL